MSDNPNPLNPKKIAERIRVLNEDAGMAAQAITHKINVVNFERAIQIGYEMACRDNGLPIPTFKDPLKELLERL